MQKNNQTKKVWPIAPGHSACAGCGQLIAARAIAENLGKDVIIANATGCLEVTTSQYPNSSWGLPWIHSLFENASSVASGIRAALDYEEKKKKNNPPNPSSSADRLYQGGTTKVIAQGGDGGTFDIGLGLVSGMWERGDDVLYICYDTEAYSNTGIQASGATPWAANTTTTPAGKCFTKPEELKSCNQYNGVGSQQRKKDMIAIALAHGLNYVAQTTAGFPLDIANKLKKALAMKGPRYIQILSPCVPGWNIDPGHAVKLGKLAAQTGLYPSIEYTNGQLTSAMKVPNPRIKVDEYLKLQGRFSHLFKGESGKKEIEQIQKAADENIKKYGL